MKDGKSNNKLGLLEKSSYGAAGLAGGLTRNMIGLYLVFYYTDVIGLNPAYVGAAIMIANVWDAVTDPLMGFISDHTHSRFGRRRIYLLAGAIPFGILLFFTWSPPAGLVGAALFVYLAVILSLLYANYTVVTVPYLALGAELSPDPDERSSVFGFNFAFSYFGMLCGAIIPNLVLEFSDNIIVILHERLGLFSDGFTQQALQYFGERVNAFRFTAAGIGLLMTLSCLITFVGTRERVVLEKEKEPAERSQVFKTLYGDMLSTLRNRPFFILLMTMLTIDIGSGITSSLMMFVGKYWVKMEHLIAPFMATYMLCAIVSAAFWVQLSKRTTKKLSYLIGQSILTIALFCTFFMVEGKPVRIFVLFAFSGIGLGAYVMLWSLIADLVDYDEYKTHQRREGSYYGIYTLFSKTAAGIGIFLAGVYLKIIGFEKGATVTPDILLKIKMLFGPLTALINLAGVILFCFLHYDKEEHAQIQSELAGRKEGTTEEALSREDVKAPITSS